jgi:hypothetical protein
MFSYKKWYCGCSDASREGPYQGHHERRRRLRPKTIRFDGQPDDRSDLLRATHIMRQCCCSTPWRTSHLERCLSSGSTRHDEATVLLALVWRLKHSHWRRGGQSRVNAHTHNSTKKRSVKDLRTWIRFFSCSASRRLLFMSACLNDVNNVLTLSADRRK